MPLKALRKVFLWTVIVLGGFYAFTIIYLMMNEESMIFFPSSSIVVTPADSGWQYREIEFSAENSITINGWKIEGKSIADSLPVILYLHGNGGNISYNMAALSVLRLLAKEVYAFDYRGYGNWNVVPINPDFYRYVFASGRVFTNTEGGEKIA